MDTGFWIVFRAGTLSLKMSSISYLSNGLSWKSSGSVWVPCSTNVLDGILVLVCVEPDWMDFNSCSPTSGLVFETFGPCHVSLLLLNLGTVSMIVLSSAVSAWSKRSTIIRCEGRFLFWLWAALVSSLAVFLCCVLCIRMHILSRSSSILEATSHSSFKSLKRWVLIWIECLA